MAGCPILATPCQHNAMPFLRLHILTCQWSTIPMSQHFLIPTMGYSYNEPFQSSIVPTLQTHNGRSFLRRHIMTLRSRDIPSFQSHDRKTLPHRNVMTLRHSYDVPFLRRIIAMAQTPNVPTFQPCYGMLACHRAIASIGYWYNHSLTRLLNLECASQP